MSGQKQPIASQDASLLVEPPTQVGVGLGQDTSGGWMLVDALRSFTPPTPAAADVSHFVSSGRGGRIRPERSRGRTATAPINKSSGDTGYSFGCFLWRGDAGTAALICPLAKVAREGGREEEEERPSPYPFA